MARAAGLPTTGVPALRAPGGLPQPAFGAADPAITAKILAVDDDEANLVALRSILADLGQPVVVARNGEDALRKLLADDFAIILLDVRMPVMDGYEAASLIRGRERTRHIPIIFMSAVDRDQSHLFRGYAAGAVDYVFKPIEPAILRAKVGVFIELRRRAEQEKHLLAENLRVRAEQVRTAEALQRTLAQQSLVLETLPIALFVAAAGGEAGRRRFVGGNPAKLLQLGEAEVEQALDGWLERVHAADRARVEAAWREAEASGSLSLEYRFRCGGESWRWLFERASLPSPCRPGEREMVGFLSDVSQRKLLEEQLAHAQKMEAIGQMTGGIAHDFNNMLSVIIGSLGRVAGDESLGEKQRQRVDLALQAGQSCAALTRRLLAFGRRQALEPRLLKLDEEIARLTSLFDQLLGKGIRTEIDCPAEVWPIHLDASQFESAIFNLVINARDAMPEGGTLRIAARNLPARAPELEGLDLAAGDYVRLQVVDSGTGMSEEVARRALEPFFTTKVPGKGTGLGLSSIYGFVRQSNGILELDSEEGRGTAVNLYLPRAETAAEPAAGPGEPSGALDLAGRRILLVEDDDDVREVARGMLEALGCRVEVATSGDEALEREPGLEDLSILFTDCVMPGSLDGLSLAAAFRRRRPEVAVLTTSAYHEFVHTAPRGADAPAFLAKPYTQDELAAALARLSIPGS
ncbi:His Kinase A (phospho-acceptor) domain-containing protein [Tistlia consotensis]|uniref:histidine kinase n=1 Tax=Tistlia consotensis USBA 355 TaxID=560819 RepID=A0A1Y6BJS6_9PROT|nr:response regulator [Tistlia consotensis]SMF14470.1 His Kinase A (phospho-acceptor) domain-containing protein [Tistlia consotensis USBA 355]SNR49511.1 His Kinase A (phospho-acceptor) domain-containing protein [Tistlia consotensis]